MSLTPPTRLPAELTPQPGPLRYGLFNVALPQTLPEVLTVDGGRQDDNFRDHAFGSGMFYDPPGCGQSHLWEIDCDTPVTKTFDPNRTEVAVTPFLVYSTLTCGMPSNVGYYTSKNAGVLYATEQEAVEGALWAGTAGNGPWIADPAGPYGAPVDVGGGGTFANVTDAVAALEQHAYGAAHYGYDATLHARSSVAAYAADANLIHTSRLGFSDVWGVGIADPTLRTPLGTKWSFGGGYPGTGVNNAAVAAGKTYIWITGNVTVWRDEVWQPPDPLRSQMDRTLNQLKLIAERRYLATFDCFHAYALVSIPKVAV